MLRMIKGIFTMNIAIIDDSAADQKITANYLHTYFSYYFADIPYSVHFFSSGEDFLSSFTKHFYDLIFIDYYMKSLSGFETAKIIRSTDKQVLLYFTTCSCDFAIDGYKVQASGYLVKPFNYKDFSELIALSEIKRFKNQQFIEVVNGMEKIKILIREIIYCDVAGHYTQIHMKNNSIKKIRMAFSDLAQLLLPFPEFITCYRGCLINMNYIVRIEDLNFLMQCGDRIPFRKKEQSKIMDAYSEFLFDKVRYEMS